MPKRRSAPFDSLKGNDFAADWRVIEESGLAGVIVPEDSGGFGGNWDDAFVLIRLVGRRAVSLPLPNSILATHSGHVAGIDLTGASAFAASVEGTMQKDRFNGALHGLSCGLHAAHAIGLLNDTLIVLDGGDAASVDTRENLAGETRDTLRFDNMPARAVKLNGWHAGRLHRLMALFRAAQMAGALETALNLSVQYTRERKQFGRPLAAFQAIQQQLAVLAEETAAADIAAAAGFHALNAGEAEFECAAAKLRANQAAAIGASIAHQVHGAMGFTQEYPLQKYMRRLWAWRSEFGNDRYWANKIGARIAARGADAFWPDLTVAAAARSTSASG